MSAAEGRAYARAALLGNPSDGYGGRTIGFAMRNFGAEVRVEESSRSEIEPGAAQALLAATVRRFHAHLGAVGEPVAAVPLQVRWHTSIPREVGLGGSSAIVIAALRALCSLTGTSIEPEVLPSLALSVETQELGIDAGLQDRVAQTYEGLTFMDFEPRALAARGHGEYERLDPSLLPPLLVAYRAEAAEPSARPHADLRRRFEAGDPDVRSAIDEIADLATRGRGCLLEGDHAMLRELVDRNLEARRRLHELDPRHIRMVAAARSAGAVANYAGSGGAITAIPADGELGPVRSALEEEGCDVVVPEIPR